MRILISILILFHPLLSFSQELKVSVDKNPALTNEVIQLQFLINAQGSNFIPPSLTNFHVLNGPSQGFSQSYSNINGQTNREITTTISYNIQAKKAGEFIIGPASVSVDNQIIKSKNIEIVVKSTGKKNKNTNNEKQVFIKLHINKSEIFIGEQISAISKVYIKNGVNIQNTEISPITYDGFWEDEVKINTNKQQREIIDGVAYTVIKFRHSVLTSQKDGDIIIPSSEMNISIQTRGKLISNHPFFGPQYQTILKSESINSRPRKIKVKELPLTKPKHFYGIVSEKFTINTSIDRANLKTSEAISLKVIFRGKGNINMLEPFELEFPSSFEIFDPTITDETFVGNNNTVGTKTFEYTIIPRKKGSFAIPEIKFVYFNPKTKKYIEL
ncbi:MAG: protein BatD, partial [Flavobacteriales bacterium]|nr:protein BatD [Flavobacteriales bacterium]